MVVTECRNLVAASGSGDGNGTVEIQAAVKKRQRQGDGVSTHGRNDVRARSESLRHGHMSATQRDANKNKGADEWGHCRALKEKCASTRRGALRISRRQR